MKCVFGCGVSGSKPSCKSSTKGLNPTTLCGNVQNTPSNTRKVNAEIADCRVRCSEQELKKAKLDLVQTNKRSAAALLASNSAVAADAVETTAELERKRSTAAQVRHNAVSAATEKLAKKLARKVAALTNGKGALEDK